jgi:hypothetical protein
VIGFFFFMPNEQFFSYLMARMSYVEQDRNHRHDLVSLIISLLGLSGIESGLHPG